MTPLSEGTGCILRAFFLPFLSTPPYPPTSPFPRPSLLPDASSATTTGGPSCRPRLPTRVLRRQSHGRSPFRASLSLPASLYLFSPSHARVDIPSRPRHDGKLRLLRPPPSPRSRKVAHFAGFSTHNKTATSFPCAGPYALHDPLVSPPPLPPKASLASSRCRFFIGRSSCTTASADAVIASRTESYFNPPLMSPLDPPTSRYPSMRFRDSGTYRLLLGGPRLESASSPEARIQTRFSRSSEVLLRLPNSFSSGTMNVRPSRCFRPTFLECCAYSRVSFPCLLPFLTVSF